MREFHTDTEIAVSRARWELEMRAYAEVSSAILRQSRRLEIRDAAIYDATIWLTSSGCCNVPVPKGHILLFFGDEHLEQACIDTLRPNGIQYDFMYNAAFFEWLRKNQCLGLLGWWVGATWAINDPIHMLDFASPFQDRLQLIPNETYLRTESFDCRGTHAICYLRDGRLESESLSEWVDSV